MSALVTALPVGLLGGCLGSIAGEDSGGDGPPGGGKAGGSSGTAVGGSAGTHDAELAACLVEDTLRLGPSFMARLTSAEYERTLRDLLGPLGIEVGARKVPADPLIAGFDNAKAQAPSIEYVESFRDSALELGNLDAATAKKVAPCTAGDAAGQDACGSAFIEGFGRRAFRRPLSAEESARYATFFTQARGQWGYEVAVGLTLQTLLQSPQFLYRMERGLPVEGNPGVRRLTSHELATRLAYLLTGTMPDADLLAAADVGALEDAAAMRAQAERLLDTDDARGMVARFHDRWLEIDHIAALDKKPELFPYFTPAVETSMREAAARFAEWAFWDGEGSLTALLTDSRAFVDDQLAPLYGVDAPGAELTLVDLGDRRAGFLTQAGWLATKAAFAQDAPVKRGVFVRERILCSPPPSPPADVNTNLPEPEELDRPMTTREVLEQRHHEGACGACHRTFDGLGFAFGHYDAVGAWRDEDNGLPVDATGHFEAIDGLEGAFSDAVDMMKQIARAPRAAECAVTQWLRFGLRREAEDLDRCEVLKLASGFSDSGLDMRGLLLDFVGSDAFLHLGVQDGEEAQP